MGVCHFSVTTYPNMKSFEWECRWRTHTPMWMHTVVSYFNTLAWENRSKFCTRTNWFLTEKLSPSVLCFERGLCSSTNPCCLLALVGICLIYLDVAYCSYYTVLFGVARSLGVLSQVGCKTGLKWPCSAHFKSGRRWWKAIAVTTTFLEIYLFWLSKRINSICDLGVFVYCLFYPLLNMQLIWDRVLGLPIERPKSMTFEYIENYCKSKVA